MRKYVYATTNELKALMYKWQNTNEPLTKDEISMAMHCVREVYNSRESYSWTNATDTEIGWY